MRVHARTLLSIICLLLLAMWAPGQTASSTALAVGSQRANIVEGYGKLPLAFEANQGQTDPEVKFLSRGAGYAVFLTGDEAVLEVKPSTESHQPSALRSRVSAIKKPIKTNIIRMRLEKANTSVKASGSEQLSGVSNYFIGKDPAKWRTNVPTYAKVKYSGIYPGIDLIYYGNQRQLEYDFIVAPGADPRRIAFDVKGANRIRRGARGELVLKVGDGEVRWHKPVAYQEKHGKRHVVAASYAITQRNRVRFKLAKYDRNRTLFIDPLIYSTYLGGSGDDLGNGIAVDSAGNAYLTGMTWSTDFPTTPGAFQTSCNRGDCANPDVFVAKLNPEGSALLYSTYLGGTNSDTGGGIAVDSAGNAYVTGNTNSADFPITTGAFQTICKGDSGCDDAFVTKLNSSGSALVYSTYLGGAGGELGSGIAVDGVGHAYITGYTLSTDFPVTPKAFQTICNGGTNCGDYTDAFVTKLSSSGSALIYSTYLGGSNNDTNGLGAIAVDGAGHAYITGETSSSDFPTSPGAFQTVYRGAADAYVTKLNSAGSALVYSTYLGGGDYDVSLGIVVDGAGEVYVTGGTSSSDFPTSPGAFQPVYHGGGDAFVTKLNSSGAALMYSTYLGGGSDDCGFGIAVDSAGDAYVTGATYSTGFPATPNANQQWCYSCYWGWYDAFVTRLDPSGSALVYSTFLGGDNYDVGRGIALDNVGNAYVIGSTWSTNFPHTLGAFQTTNGGRDDAFVSKLFLPAFTTTTLTSSLNPSTYPHAVTFTAKVTSGLGPPPDGETVTFGASFRKRWISLGTGTLSGGSASVTVAALKAGNYAIVADYYGDANFSGSSSILAQVVNKATTTTTLTSSLNPSNYGQSVTFTATLTPQFGGTVKGTVSFYDGGTWLGNKYLSKGRALFTTSTLSQGTHTITARYKGNVNFIGSSASLTQTVN